MVNPNRLDDPRELRFANVGTYDGEPFDLVLRNTSEYVAGNKDLGIGISGCLGYFGAMDVAQGSDVRVNFAFEHADGTPLVLPEFYFSFYDIDQPQNVGLKGGNEKLKVEGSRDLQAGRLKEALVSFEQARTPPSRRPPTR